MRTAVKTALDVAQSALVDLAVAVESQVPDVGEVAELLPILDGLRHLVESIGTHAVGAGAGMLTAHVAVYEVTKVTQVDPPLEESGTRFL